MNEYHHTLMSDQRFRAANATNQHPGSGTEGLEDFHRPVNSWYLVGLGFIAFIVGLFILEVFG